MVYQEIFEARYQEMRHDYRQANEGSGYPGALRRAFRRLASR